MGVSALLSAFSANIHLAFLSVVRAEAIAGSTSKIFLASLLVFNLFVAIYVSKNSFVRIDARRVVLLGAFYGIVACALLVTYETSVVGESNLLSEIQSYLVTWMLCVAASYSVSKVGSLNGLVRVVPIIVLIYTLGSLFALAFSTGLTTGGLMADGSGLNYQSNSYCAAYAIGLTMYYLTHFDSSKKLRIFRYRLFAKPFWYLLMVCQLSVLVLSGGRGGLVTAFLVAIYCAITQKEKLISDIRKAMSSAALVLVGIAFFLAVMGTISFGYDGLDRILSFLDGRGDENRSQIASNAIALFLSAPMFGHGAGSVFGLLGTYSHNFVLDILVEYGLFGAALIIFFAAFVVCKLVRCIKADSRFELLGYLLIMGIAMLAFSSYYLVCALLVLPATLMIIWPMESFEYQNQFSLA